MSAIPKPASLPAPKALNGVKDYQATEHEQLLRTVWSKIDAGVERLIGWGWPKACEHSRNGIAAFEASCVKAAETLTGMAERCEDEALRAQVLAVRERLEDAELSSKVARWGKDLLKTEVTEKHLAFGLVEERQAGTVRAHEEVVGYVDMALKVSVPEVMRLKHSLPACLTREGHEVVWRDPLKAIMTDPKKAEVILGFQPEVPGWVCERKTATVWVDVRVQTPPLGQLLREVRVLQSFDRRAKVVVVLPVSNAETNAMLANIGAIATTAQWWTDLKAGSTG